MKKNTKFIWIYGAILFSFALILILFAGLTQSNNEKEVLKENAGIKQSMTKVTEKNTKLSERISELEKELKTLTEQNTQLTLDRDALISAYGNDAETTKLLMEAYGLYSTDKKEEAKQKIEALDVHSLTQAQKYVYDTIIGE